MQISLEWLSELVNIWPIIYTYNLDFFIQKLTLGGFEVEGISKININNNQHTVLEITATANRADSLSIQGIAKEVRALLAVKYINSVHLSSFHSVKSKLQSTLLKNKLVNSQLMACSFFLAISVRNVHVSNSPNWLKRKLQSSGIEPKNNLLDFQNYILLETGYYFELYDLEKIYSNLNSKVFNLIISSGDSSHSFLATNNCNYKLNSDILVLKANKELLSIAGIITNSDFQYSNATNSILIEGSIFDSKKIRQTSRKISLRTERSARYEKNINSHNLIEAFWRFLYLLRVSNESIICKIHTAALKENIDKPNIVVNYKTINQVLGPVYNIQNGKYSNLKRFQISNYLKRLGFKFFIKMNPTHWIVSVPIDREEDILRPIDLIEEIGRLHGFNNFITQVPKINKIGTEDFSYQVRRKLINCFLSEGLNEVINYSLTNFKEIKNVSLINPLLNDYSKLRSTLLPGLVKIISENLKQTSNSLEAFESGHVFFKSDSLLSYETEQIAGSFGGTKIRNSWSTNTYQLSWFEGKGKLENILRKLNLLVYWRSGLFDIYKGILHSHRTGIIYLSSGLPLGIFGQIHPILAKQLNISSEIYLFELNIETISYCLKSQILPTYQLYSLYPKVTKDIAFIISKEISFEQIKHTILLSGTKLLNSVKLIDEYNGKSIPSGKTSLCIQLTFQSVDRTLFNNEIEKIIKRIEKILIAEFDVTVRV